MGKQSEIPDRITPLFFTSLTLFVHTLSIKVLILEKTQVGLVIVGKNPSEVNNK